MRKIKWGVIGAGGIADRRTLPGMMLADNAELVAVMEVNMELSEKLREKYNAKFAYDNYADLLANDEIEAVYIASPVICHKEQAIAAAKAGKHILLEKPAALTIEDGEEILEAAKDAGVLIASGFMMRYHGYHQKVREMIAQGAIGNIVSARGQLTCWYPEIEGAWRQDKSQSGGGALMDMGVHCIDLIEYITGSRVVETCGFNNTRTFSYNVDDSSNILCKLDNGAVAYVDSHFNIPDEAAFCRLEFYGTKGSILCEGTVSQIEAGEAKAVLTGDAGGYNAAQNRTTDGAFKVEAELGNMYTKEIESFGNSVINGTALTVPLEDAIHVQKVAMAAYTSTEEKKFVEVK
ncbi:MAG: Gfo/Idh/MocA family oxidoreductase [Clostridia bacterium]|nr:Gfo/Idh/MocA family oxidoreductase [Clostridia bacterium]